MFAHGVSYIYAECRRYVYTFILRLFFYSCHPKLIYKKGNESP